MSMCSTMSSNVMDEFGKNLVDKLVVQQGKMDSTSVKIRIRIQIQEFKNSRMLAKRKAGLSDRSVYLRVCLHFVIPFSLEPLVGLMKFSPSV